MSTSNKKIIIIFAFILLFLNFVTSNCLALVPKSNNFYVNDTAHIMDAETSDYIIRINKELYEKTGAQIAVVTLNNLEGMSVEDYSTQLFRSYGIGDSKKNNGILFLVSLEERQTRIEVGYGLEGTITDGRAGRILDNYVLPYFKEDNWNYGIYNGFNAILKEVMDEYDITLDGSESATNANEQSDYYAIVQYLTAFIVLVLCLIIRYVFNSNILLRWCVGERNWTFCYIY